jgi:hypothetical protein
MQYAWQNQEFFLKTGVVSNKVSGLADALRSRRRLSKTKKFVFCATSAVLLMILVEVLSFAVGSFVRREIFSREDDYLASLTPAEFERWRASPWFDAELGWNVPIKRMTATNKNCLKQMVTYSYQDEYRGTPRPGVAAVALFGDSFTYGDEVDDNSTNAAALERLIKAPVLNYGVLGYSPEQAVLKFERLAKRQQMPKVAVLVIMHEDIRRVVSSFRPVGATSRGFETRMGLKPYIAGDALIEMPSIATYDEFVAEAKRRFEEDFWARPQFSFPYALSLFRAVTNNSFFIAKVASLGRPQFSYEYEGDNPLLRALDVPVQRWRSSVSAAGVIPFVLFVPRNQNDNGVSAQYVKSLNARAGQTFAFEFEDPSIDWRRYNLNPNGTCHPSAYGHERIAAYIATHVINSLPQMQ